MSFSCLPPRRWPSCRLHPQVRDLLLRHPDLYMAARATLFGSHVRYENHHPTVFIGEEWTPTTVDPKVLSSAQTHVKILQLPSPFNAKIQNQKCLWVTVSRSARKSRLDSENKNRRRRDGLANLTSVSPVWTVVQFTTGIAESGGAEGGQPRRKENTRRERGGGGVSEVPTASRAESRGQYSS